MYKQVGLQCWDAFDRDWSDYDIESRSMLSPSESNKASKDLRVLYLSRRLLFAWQYCIEQENDKCHQHWFVLKLASQLFWQAELQKTLTKNQRVHTVFAYDDANMRPNYPCESDYAATVGCKGGIAASGWKLRLHGRFQNEYAELSFKEKVLNFCRVYDELGKWVEFFTEGSHSDQSDYLRVTLFKQFWRRK